MIKITQKKAYSYSTINRMSQVVLYPSHRFRLNSCQEKRHSNHTFRWKALRGYASTEATWQVLHTFLKSKYISILYVPLSEKAKV